MIVILVTARECHDLIATCAHPGLKARLSQSLKLEDLLPDDNLPHSILLTRLDDTYACVLRQYATELDTERAWNRLIEPVEPLQMPGRRRTRRSVTR